MKKTLFLIISYLLAVNCYAQSGGGLLFGCGSAEIHKANLQQDTSLARQMQRMEEHINQYIAKKTEERRNKSNSRIADPVITIPVVFHIVLPNPSIISTAQVNAQITELNKHFNIANPVIYSNSPFYSASVDTKIRFCSAPSDRINYAVNATFVNNDPRLGNTVAPKQNNALNVWVCDLKDPSRTDLLGYGKYPYSTSQSDPNDGVVIDFNVFGVSGNNYPDYNQGKTLTHEVGHWLGLFHPWGDDSPTSPLQNPGQAPTCSVDGDGLLYVVKTKWTFRANF